MVLLSHDLPGWDSPPNQAPANPRFKIEIPEPGGLGFERMLCFALCRIAERLMHRKAILYSKAITISCFHACQPPDVAIFIPILYICTVGRKHLQLTPNYNFTKKLFYNRPQFKTI